MRPTAPLTHDAAVALLRRQVPEFEELYQDLLDIYDEDLTAEIVLMELADFVADLLVGHEREELLERSLDAVERLVAGSAATRRLVDESFLPALSPLTVERIRPTVGPATAELLDEAIDRGDLRP